MRLDHIAYRVADKNKTANFFQNCFGYVVGTEFNLEFDDGSTTECVALAPPEERSLDTSKWTYHALLYNPIGCRADKSGSTMHAEFHAPPEIFISDGPEGSIVGDWVAERDGVGGVHHMAYQVGNVEETMKEWTDKGYAEWYTEKPLVCSETNLVQVFSKPSELTGVIYELIKRGEDHKGFCEKNVKALMESTKG